MSEDILDAAKNIEVPSAVPPMEPPPPLPATPPENANAQLVESILESGSPSTIIAPPKDHVSPPQPVKKGISGVLLALVLLVIGGSVVAGSYFVSQRQQIADTRSKAMELDCRNDGEGCKDGYICSKYDDGTYGCKPKSSATNTPRPAATNTPRPAATNTPRPAATATPASSCQQVGCSGSSCSVGSSYPECYVNHYKCDKVLPRGTGCSDRLVGRAVRNAALSSTCGTEQIDIYCPSCSISGNNPQQGNFITKYYDHDCSAGGGGGGGGGGGENGACTDIRIYKGTTQVTPSDLAAGDAVKLAVKGSGGPSKAHFRINGGAWQETTTAASGWFVLDYTIPSGVTDFVIEAEVFVDGAWK